MNIFKTAKDNVERVTGGKVTRNCDHCGTPYEADSRNLKRGWGKSCSKSCAASLREKSRPGYDPARVEANNIRRILWNDNPSFKDENEYGVYRGRRTSEGYKMYERENDEFTAIDEFGDPIYNGHTWYDDPGDSEYWEGK
jgi:hypothetical protein